MPRGNLNERYVQAVAVNWLAAQLRDRQTVQAVIAVEASYGELAGAVASASGRSD